MLPNNEQTISTDKPRPKSKTIRIADLYGADGKPVPTSAISYKPEDYEDDETEGSFSGVPAGVLRHVPRFEYNHKTRTIEVNHERKRGSIEVAKLRTAEDFKNALDTYAPTPADRLALGDEIEEALDYHFNPNHDRFDLDAILRVPTLEDIVKNLRPGVELDWPAPSELPAIVRGSEFCHQDLEEPPEVVYGVLHQGSKLVLGGASKSNKTWTLLDLALSVANGEPWLSQKTSKGPVLYLNLEIAPWAFRERIQYVCDAKHVPMDNDNFHVWNLRGYSASYLDLLPKISRGIKEHGYVLIILDPIYKLLGELNENDAGDIGKMMTELETLAQSAGAAIAFGAHFSKGNQAGKESIDRISGSGVFARDPDSILTFTRHQEEGAFIVETTVRNFKPVPQFVVRWDFPLFRRDESLNPTEFKRPAKGGRTAIYSIEHILSVLTEGGLTTSQWEKAAREEGISKATFHRLLEAAQGSQRITKNSANKWQVSKVSKPGSETSETSRSHNPLGYETTETTETGGNNPF
jgi:hypothetical protein